MASTTRPTNCSTALQRLKQDYLRLAKDPVPYVTAEPLPTNLFEWHYVIKGPSDSPYKGGYYHGKLIFPRDFPFRPPSIYMITPNGRFACNTRLCLSISDFHPDTWNPAWSVSSILTGLLSFMLENTCTMGSVVTSVSTKKQLARNSGDFNLKSEIFCELFPGIVKEIRENITAEELHNKLQNSSDQRQSHSDGNTNNSGVNGENRNEWQISKLFVIIVFSIFAFLVQLVMRFLEPV
ncbi:Ubiquitin-conjugating enzyme E2 J2 [Schistosoma japonicum]|uniref:Ubiquitin-conjugating enzyme E2 J2 n=1 Tax=Schistosoma japonicum TaxID=6182 RepID=C1LLU2_SCHJA|nr:Ubiquitin-conjugating enzyme E2 J2 [Schistosoma japonicum]CAX70684.1 hypotherical protein [Schistosoma japonicum]CAX70685.1 hypotherical protein [Schistosoma japonicum]CAX75670.1 hypotherical protein [Schistosoma japonicum]